MMKIKITEQQKRMLEVKAKAKLVSEDEGGIHISPSNSPSRKINNQFKQQAGKIVEDAESTIHWRELAPHVHELIKQMYTNPTKEAMNPFWESVGVSWDEIIEMLTALDLIKSVRGGYRLSKIVKDPVKAIKIVSKLIEKMINDKVYTIDELTNDDIKKSWERQLQPQPKTGKTRDELLKFISDKRAKELERRKIEKNRPIGEDNYPMGAKYDPRAPYNQPDSKPNISVNEQPFNLIWSDDREFAIFKKDGKLYLYNIEAVDDKEYEEYASRDVIDYEKDEDGDIDVTYGEWELNGDVISAYVNDNYSHLSFGKGYKSFDNGIDMVEIDSELAKELLTYTKYIKHPNNAKRFHKILSSLTMEETTTAGSSGSYVGTMRGGSKFKSNVGDEMTSIVEHDPEQEPYMDKLMRLFDNGNVTPEQWLSSSNELYSIIEGLKNNDNYSGIIGAIIKMLQVADMMRDIPEVVPKLVGVFDTTKNQLVDEIRLEKDLPVKEATTVGSVGGDSGTFAYDAPVGDGSDFWNAGNKLNKRSKKNKTNEMVARRNKDAKTDTQWPDGKFVEFDDCVKFNNNKVAQNGGCSTGAVDGVVKTKSSKNSVISDSSIYEEISKVTGIGVKEVKSIIDRKITKSS